ARSSDGLWFRHVPGVRAAPARGRCRTGLGSVLHGWARDADARRRLESTAGTPWGGRGMSGLDLPVDLGRGLLLPNPVGLASGTAGYGFELRRLIDLDRLGALYTKGTTRLPRAGNAPPRVAETTAGLLNSIGLQNPGVDWVAEHYAPRFAEWGVPVIVNVAGEDAEDYVQCVRRLENVAGIAGIELNISCPNIAHGLDFGRDPAAAARLVAAVRDVTHRSLMVRLSPNVTDIAAVARA